MADPEAVARRYLEHLTVERGLADNTLAAYRRDLQRYVGFLAARRIGDLDAVDAKTIRAFIASVSASTHGPDGDPFSTITRDAFAAWIKKEPLLFSPGSAVLYSNFGFDLLAMSLSAAARKPYPDLLQENIKAPTG